MYYEQLPVIVKNLLRSPLIYLSGEGGETLILFRLSSCYHLAYMLISDRSHCDNGGLHYLNGRLLFITATRRLCGGALTRRSDEESAPGSSLDTSINLND